MKDVMGVIYTGERDSFLRELTLMRAVAAVPVFGRYRVIDFLVSSMVNSGIRKVGVIMQKNYHSLMDHLGSGKEWDLHGKNDGLYILPPFLTNDNVGVYTGSLDALQANMNFLSRSHKEYVLICNSLILFNADFSEMFDQYVKSGCEAMMMYSKDQSLKRKEYGTYLDIDEKTGRVLDIEIDPTEPHYDNIGMEVILMRRERLIQLVGSGVAHGYHELTRDVLQRLIRDAGMNVRGYCYKDICFRLDSIQNYFNMNQQFLEADTRHEIFPDNRPVYTKVRDELPARYLKGSKITNSCLADGCIISGTVDHSVLFRGVKIEEGAVVRNCVIMQDCVIQSGAHLENCILDKQALIHGGSQLIGPKAYPIVISKNMKI